MRVYVCTCVCACVCVYVCTCVCVSRSRSVLHRSEVVQRLGFGLERGSSRSAAADLQQCLHRAAARRSPGHYSEQIQNITQISTNIALQLNTTTVCFLIAVGSICYGGRESSMHCNLRKHMQTNQYESTCPTQPNTDTDHNWGPQQCLRKLTLIIVKV